MDKDFILKRGMHAGKTIAEIEMTNPSYIEWAKKNAPNLLRDKKTKIKESSERIEPLEKNITKSSIQPNLNFFNEKN